MMLLFCFFFVYTQPSEHSWHMQTWFSKALINHFFQLRQSPSHHTAQCQKNKSTFEYRFLFVCLFCIVVKWQNSILKTIKSIYCYASSLDQLVYRTYICSQTSKMYRKLKLCVEFAIYKWVDLILIPLTNNHHNIHMHLIRSVFFLLLILNLLMELRSMDCIECD